MGIWQAELQITSPSTLNSKCICNLQNPDFEKPPTNIPKNSTNQFIPLNSTINTLPGWSYQGTVQYVISSGQGGYAIYLGQDGKINQTFKAIGEFDLNYDYLLTFNLKPAQPNCTSPTSVTISVPNRSVVVSFEKKFGNQSNWQTHACYLGVYGNKELINLTLENQSTNTTKCGVILDSFILNVKLIKQKKNLVLNGGFEVGPAFPNNSYGGILINKNYEIPKEICNRACFGKSSGVQTTVTLKKDSGYQMKVFFSGKNDACIGSFEVVIQAGSEVHNYTIRRTPGILWSAILFTIKADSSVTPISIRSITTTKTKDQVFCGPIIDNVVLVADNVASYGLKLQTSVVFVGIGFLATNLAQIIG
ncbi:hypothetical protein MKW92_027222 [Papaver armeniacum]|nr:hypothetical protein MKW92_027222 [Papaver armeniacum]